MSNYSILYTLGSEVYANITNQCDCNCIFCIRRNGNGVGSAENLWLKEDPSLEEILQEMEQFDFTPYRELVYCGYGEPTCALDSLVESAKYIRSKGLAVRLNTNGLGNLFHKRDIVPELAKVVDHVSISLNAPDAVRYAEVSKPKFGIAAFDEMLHFALSCKEHDIVTQFSVVDVLTPEEIEACRKLSDEMEIPLRVRKWEH